MRAETTRPVDLVAVVAWSLGAVAAALLLPEGSWPRVALALPFLLLAPGYALVAALFPERSRTYTVAKGEDATREEEVSEGLDPLERIGLSLGLSLAVVPLLGLGLNFTPWGIRLVPILVAVTGFVLLASAAAWFRRERLPEAERLRFAVAFDEDAWRAQSRLDKALTVLLALSVLAAAGALAYVLSTPRPQEAFTEFYILGPGGKAADYPSNMTPGSEALVIVGTVNHEGEPTPYAWRAVFVAGTFEGEGANRTFVPGTESPAGEQRFTLADEEEREENFTFRAPTTPGTYRLEWRLEKEGVATEEPYRRLHLWINVA